MAETPIRGLTPVVEEPIGVILAGGAGRRIGGSKAIVELHGRPLIAYPLEAMRAVLPEVALLARADTELPTLPGVTIWVEPQTPRHPLTGILNALSLAEGRAVVVCASDLPFVTPEAIRQIVSADAGEAPAVVACCGEEIQPLLGCYQPRCTELLAPAVGRDDVRLLETISAIGPRLVDLGDPELLFNVNTPDDLLQAAAMLDRRRAATRR